MSSMIIKVIDGPKAGLTSPVFDGLSLGRKKTQIALEDPKSSNLHAIIEKHDDNFMLVDQKSRNGIKFQGQKVERLILEPGIEFVIGGSTLKIEASKPIKKSSTPEPEKPSTSSVNMENFEFQSQKPKEEQKDFEGVDAIEIEPVHWTEVVKNFVNDHQELLKDKNNSVMAFPHLIELKIIRGIQAGKSWTLGYGPRKAGKSSLDIQLFDKAALDICFELVPTEKGCLFQTASPDKILLDGKSEKSKVLKGGEIITVGITELEVGFIYE